LCWSSVRPAGLLFTSTFQCPLAAHRVMLRHTFLAALGVRSDPICAQRDTLSRAKLREAIAR